jgi:hypothetical protein
MRPGMIILAILVLGVPVMSAMAQTIGPVDAYRGTSADKALTGGAEGVTIGNPPAERGAVMARLDQRRTRQTNDTVAGEPAGGSGMGGSAGGVGSR